MRIVEAHVDGIANLINLDMQFNNIGPGIVCVSGANGAGKSHFIECLVPASLYREFPSYQKNNGRFSSVGEGIPEHSPHGNSRIAVKYAIGTDIIETNLVTKNNKLEAFLTVNGVVVSASGRLKEYDEHIAKIFPTKEVCLASQFAVQSGTGSFFKLDKETRRALFLDLLGITRLQDEHSYISKGYRRLSQTLDELYVQQKELSSIKDAKVQLQELIDESRLQLSALDQELINIDLWIKLASGWHDELVETQYRALEIERELSKYTDLEKSDLDLSGIRANMSAVDLSLTDIEAYLADLQGWATDDIAALSELRATHGKYIAGLVGCEDTLARVNKYFTEALERHSASLSKIDKVDLNHPMCKVCPLTADFQQGELTYTQLYFFYKHEVGVFTAKIDLLRNRIKSTEEEIRMYEVGNEADASWKASVDASCKLLKSLKKDLKTNEDLALQMYSRRLELDRIDVLRADLVVLNDILEEASEKCTHFEDKESRRDDIISEKASLTTAIALRTEQYESTDDFKGIEDRLNYINSEIKLTDGGMYLYYHLSDCLKRLRKNEIDEACPEVENYTNELLSVFSEGRFQVRLDTVVPKKGTDEMKEDFVPSIVDTASNRVATGVSGGETAMIDEALRLGICIFNARKSGFHYETIFRDEPTGALTQETASSYMNMLRMAIEIGGFHNVYFVTHHDHIKDQADHVITIEDGKLI